MRYFTSILVSVEMAQMVNAHVSFARRLGSEFDISLSKILCMHLYYIRFIKPNRNPVYKCNGLLSFLWNGRYFF